MSRTLQQILDSKQRLNTETAIRLVYDLALALDREHKKGNLLSGIFPDQVIFNEETGPRLLELGAVRNPEDLTLSYLCFVPPECLEQQAPTVQSDLYSMGIILYSLQTGHFPFEITTRDLLVQQIKQGTFQSRPGAIGNAKLEWIIQKCLLRVPDRRFTSALDLANELKVFLPRKGIREKSLQKKQSAVRFIAKQKTVLLSGAGIVFILIALAFLFANRNSRIPDPEKWNIVRLTSERFEEIDPTISPDGSSIAFISDRAANWELYVMNRKDKKPVQLTRSPGKEENPRWSPAGNQILFSYRAPNAKPTIYSIASSGGVPQMLVSNAIDAQWSADGTEICYVAPADGPVRSLYIFNLDQETARVVSNGISGLSHPSFSMDKKEIVVSIDGHLEMFNSKTGKRHVLTKGPGDLFPAWNWKTGSIYFTSGKSGKAQIWRVNQKGETKQVLESDREDFRPCLSASGLQIVFHRFNILTDILTIDPGTGTVRNISPSSGKSIFAASPETLTQDEQMFLQDVLPDFVEVARRPGKKILAVLTGSRILLLDAETGNRTPVLMFAKGERGRRIAWSKDGKSIFYERVRPGSDLYFISGKT